MSYEPGKMGVASGTALVFTLTFTSVFLSIWSVFLDEAATAAWITPLIAGGCSLALFMILLFVMERVPGDLYEVAEQLLGKIGARLITLYFITTFFLDMVLFLRQFAENTLLTAIPDLDISLTIGWYAVMAAIVIYIGIEPIASAAFIVMPLGLAALSLLLVLLYNKFNIYNLTPWLGLGLPAVLKAGVLSSSYYLGAYLLPILASAFQDRRTIRTAAILGVGLSSAFRTITFLLYTMTFGVAVGREKVLPFFEMTRLIYVNRFLQRVETVFILLWVIFGLATVAINLYISLYLMTRLFNLSSMRPLILPVALIAAQLSLMPSDIAATIELSSKMDMTLLNIGVFAIPVILLIATLLKGKRKAKSCAIN